MLPPIPSPDDQPAADDAAMLFELVRQINQGISPGVAEPTLAAEPAADPGLEGPAPSSATAVKSREGEGTLHVVFRLGSVAFAVPGALLAEVKEYRRPIPIPGVPHWLLGIESFQGETLSVTDLGAFLRLGDLVESPTSRLMVVFEPGTRRVLAGLAVDSVATHVWLPDTESSTHLNLTGRIGLFTRRMLELDGQTLAVLDLEAMLQSPEFRQLDP